MSGAGYVLLGWTVLWIAIIARAAVIASRIPLLPPAESGGDHGLVTVLIPARNEELALAETIQRVLEQSYRRLEIIVINDHSEDATDRIADEMAAEDSRIRVIHDPPLRDGWLGKTNALDVGARAASGDWLVFLDADVHLNPNAVETALESATKRGIDGLSFIPRLITGSWPEGAVLPFTHFGLLALRPDRANDDRPGGGFAAGAFIMVSHRAYEAAGGHSAVKSEIIDDVQLGRAVKKAGYRLRIFRGEDLADIRMYTGLSSLTFGLVKNISFVIGGPGGHPLLAPLGAIALAGFVDLPLIVAATAAASGHLDLFALLAIVIPVVPIVVGARGVIFKIRHTLLYPFAVWIVVVATFIASYYRLVRGTVRWRDREVEI